MRYLHVLLAISAMTVFASPADQKRVFRAGAATANITPPLGSPLVGGWDSPPASYVHDELHARALVLDDGRTRLAIVVSDSLGISREALDAARRAVHEKTGMPASHMLFAATHTHSAASARTRRGAPATEPLTAYQSFIASRIADAVLCAIQNLEAARIGWGVGREPGQVFNRRWRMKPGVEPRNPYGGVDQVLMNPKVGDPNLLEPAGPSDPEIHFLSVQSAAGRPIALLANYSLHYVGGVPRGHVSADYFGVFSKRIGELLKADAAAPPFVGMLSNGASGDINNINFRGDPSGRKWAPYEKMRAVANAVAAEVFRVYQTLPHHDQVPLGAAQSEIPIGLRVPTRAELDWAQSVLDRPAGTPPKHIREEIYARRTLDSKESPARMPLILQTLRVGEVGIAAIPVEVFVEIGLEIRARGPFRQTFTISHANGSYGYLPTAEHHKLGGYETWRGSSYMELDAASKIVRELTRLFEGMRQ